MTLMPDFKVRVNVELFVQPPPKKAQKREMIYEISRSRIKNARGMQNATQINNNAIAGIVDGTTVPTEEIFKNDPVENSKLFVKALNNTSTLDATVKGTTMIGALSRMVSHL